ncbi:MAG: SDR family oxidoreductase [Gammaproteobacteria bacterium]|nr:MAG: SDR family oxidoreductase [Gammaproteobacteria bacterium]
MVSDTNKEPRNGVLLFGATRGTGLELARLLAARGEAATALVRPGSDSRELQALGVTIIEGDAFEPGDVERAFSSGHFRAAVSSIGGSRAEPRRPDVETTRNIIEAAKRHGPRRVLLVTMIGAGDSASVLSEHARKFLGPVAELKTQAEELLMTSGLEATVLRPGGMSSEPATGTAIMTEDHTVMGTIHRADLAALILRCLDDTTTIGRIYHTIDPEIKEAPPLQRGVTPQAGERKP